MGAFVVGLAAAGVSKLTSGPGGARMCSNFDDMLGYCRVVARVHWWVAYPESLVRFGFGPRRESPWEFLPRGWPRWLRVLVTGLAALVRMVAFLVQLLAIPTVVTLFAWVVVIAYLDRELVRQLAPETLLENIESHWSAFPGIITVVGAAVAIGFAFRRARVRALAAHRLAAEQACLGALTQMLQNLWEATLEMSKLGHDSVPDMWNELRGRVEGISHGACTISQKLAIEFVRGPRSTFSYPSTPPQRDVEPLSKAVSAIERERAQMERQGELPTLRRLLGRAGMMRDEGIHFPTGLQRSVETVSIHAVRVLIDREVGRTTVLTFDEAKRTPDDQARRRLELSAAIDLELSLRRIIGAHRRELAALARDIAESREFHVRQRRRLRPRWVDRFVVR